MSAVLGGRQIANLPDRAVPSAARQEDLEQAYAKNIAEGKAPYQGVAIRTLGELEWVMIQRNWSGDMIPYGTKEHADLSGARLEGKRSSHVSEWGINLTGVRLWGARLAGASLWRANLSGADLTGADLSAADLSGTHLTNANLNRANLTNANLGDANLSGAVLREAKLAGAYLGSCRFDVETRLLDAQFDAASCLADVVWNNVPLTCVDWSCMPTLGDEMIARERQSPHRFAFRTYAFLFTRQSRKNRAESRNEFETAARAYRQLAVALRSQGMNDDADRYAYRAQLMQRRVLRLRRRWGAAFGSWLLDAVSGYGYRPIRSVIAYGAIILFFAALYLINGQFAAPRLRWDEALVLSISSFHGRGFFTSGISLGDTLARLAAGEAIIGLLIEITFIATFTQRFFAR